MTTLRLGRRCLDRFHRHLVVGAHKSVGWRRQKIASWLMVGLCRVEGRAFAFSYRFPGCQLVIALCPGSEHIELTC